MLGVLDMEPTDLTKARDVLAQFEQDCLGKSALYHLSDGLSLLEDVIDSYEESKYSKIAKNIGNTYVSKFGNLIDNLIQSNDSIEEKSLKDYQELLIEIQHFSFGDKKKIEQILTAATMKLLEEILRGISNINKHTILENVRKKLSKT
jgi:hypothetical protein